MFRKIKLQLLFTLLLLCFQSMGCLNMKNTIFQNICGNEFLLNKDKFIEEVRKDRDQIGPNNGPSYYNTDEELNVWIEHFLSSMITKLTFDSALKKVSIKTPEFEDEIILEYSISNDTIEISFDEYTEMLLVYNSSDNSLLLTEMATPIIFDKVNK